MALVTSMTNLKGGSKMKGILFSVIIGLVAFLGGETVALAATKPIQQLPADVARWSTLWMNIPSSMVEEGQEHGPLAALTWGPAKGTAEFARATKEEVWDSLKLDQSQGYRSRTRREIGPVFRYEF